MKTLNLTAILVLVSLFCVAPIANANQGNTYHSSQSNLTSAVIRVTGMVCRSCENSIVRELSKIEGVQTVKASHRENTVTVNFDSEKISLEALKAAITKLGYQVE